MTTKLYAIDANVILRHLLADHPEQSPKARAIFEAVEDGRMAVLCDPVNLAEVAWVCKSIYKLPAEQVAAELLGLVALDGFHVPGKQLYVRALHIYGNSVPHFGDACVCAAALEECDGRVISFDKGIKNFNGLILSEAV